MRAGPGLRVLTAAVLAGVAPAAGQERPDLKVRTPGAEWSVALGTERGHAAVPASELTRLGWRVTPGRAGATLEGPGGVLVELRDGSPFFRWNDQVFQFAEAPFFEGGELYVPLQLLTDFLPERLARAYTFDGAAMLLSFSGSDAAEAEGPPARPRPVDDGVRVVVIDAGHGGDDPGSISRSGVQEKTVALGIARAVARRLESVPGLEVRMLREADTFIPVWSRGALATDLKGERPGVFVSIHANSFNSPARGFETYFLSDARTEHERRVAAIENAPLRSEEDDAPPDGDLDFILRELKNLDTQHWSVLLAELVQDEMQKIHPGPNRGVKQAPLAVITNALMPAVLVEVGYLSHPEEARLLGRPEFQERAGRAIADAVSRFFDRYPPRAGGGAGAGG